MGDLPHRQGGFTGIDKDKVGGSTGGLAQLGVGVCASARLPALAMLLGPNILRALLGGLSALCNRWD